MRSGMIRAAHLVSSARRRRTPRWTPPNTSSVFVPQTPCDVPQNYSYTIPIPKIHHYNPPRTTPISQHLHNVAQVVAPGAKYISSALPEGEGAPQKYADGQGARSPVPIPPVCAC